MLKCEFAKREEQPISVLCLGAHSDDIEIGCGGTILRLIEEYNVKDVVWIVFAAVNQRAEEAKESANLFLRGVEKKTIETYAFRDGFLPYVGFEVKERFEALKSLVSPNLILTHYRHDLHQDHRLISDLTWNTFRDHFILEYEILKYDGDFGTPNFFVQLTESICRKKIDLIRKCFKTQGSRHWFDEDALRSILRLRGLESNAPEKCAEAFYSRKAII